jgi:hypothetical protein
MGDMTLHDFPLDMVPLDDDVLSLELESAFKDCVADGDSSTLYLMAKALTKLQAMFGLISRIQVRGKRRPVSLKAFIFCQVSPCFL